MVKYVRLTCIIVALVFSCIMLDNYIKPAVTAMCQTKVKIAATQEINNSISQIFTSEEYANIALIEKDSSNRISSVQVDTLKANRLKSQINEYIVDSFNSDRVKNLQIPIGTLVGWSFFNERGFNVPIKVGVASNPDINFESKFESAGINQTKHTLYVNVIMDINIYMKPYTNKVQVVTNIPLTETIIIGNVPEFYFNQTP